MITQKAKYAVKALGALAAAPAGDSLRIDQIATRSGAPKRFLEHILLDLKRAGLIASRRGRGGGYALIRDPAKLPLSEVLWLIDGPIAPLGCLSRRAYQRCEDCEDEASCRIRKVFGEVFYAYLLLIESVTLADLADRPGEWDLPLPAAPA